MNYHSYLMITGHGLSAIPIAPFRVSRPDGADLPLHIRREGLQCRIAAASDPCDPDLVELRDGPEQPVWSLVTSIFAASWPDGFEVVSSPTPDVPPGFDLVGPHEALVFIQGPFPPDTVPSRDALAAPGQKLRDKGAVDNVEWVWLEYDHDGGKWYQVHHLVTLRGAVLLVTLQTVVNAGWESVRTTVLDLARTLIPLPTQTN